MATATGLLAKIPNFLSVQEDDAKLNFVPGKTHISLIETGGMLKSFDVRFVPNCEANSDANHLFEVNVKGTYTKPSIGNGSWASNGWVEDFFMSSGYADRTFHKATGEYRGSLIAWKEEKLSVTLLDGDGTGFEFRMVPIVVT